jgi:membrane-bound ClpP family serine protease
VSPSQIKIPSKTSRQPALAKGFDSGVKGLRYVKKIVINIIAYNKQNLLKLTALMNAKNLLFTLNTTKINLQNYVKENFTNNAQFFTLPTN